MSTEHQQYSPENELEIIRQYATDHNMCERFCTLNQRFPMRLNLLRVPGSRDSYETHAA
jgi:hypothetical protein